MGRTPRTRPLAKGSHKCDFNSGSKRAPLDLALRTPPRAPALAPHNAGMIAQAGQKRAEDNVMMKATLAILNPWHIGAHDQWRKRIPIEREWVSVVPQSGSGNLCEPVVLLVEDNKAKRTAKH